MHPDERGRCLALSDLCGQIMGATGRAKDLALFHAAEDVCSSLSTFYRPPTPPVMPAPFRSMNTDQLKAHGADFGAYRNLVLEHEEACARKLEVLRGTARTLTRLRELAHSPARIDSLLAALSSFVHSVWARDLDMSADRDWSLRVSRRYNLLPREWREL